MPNRFKKGDIVKLKSGGPDMTIDYFDDFIGSYHCLWFNGAELGSVHLDSESLKKAEPEKLSQKSRLVVSQ